jgi:hypothetical protein
VQRLQRSGKLPEPSMHLGPKSPRWDRYAVDALFGEADRQDDINEAVDRYVAKMLAEPSKRRREAVT